MFGAGTRATAAAVVLAVAGFGVRAEAAEPSTVVTSSSSVTAPDGQTYRITNHLTREATAELGREPAHGGKRPEWMLVWAGDESTTPPNPTTTDEPDFLAVVDVTKGSRTYDKVVNTVTMDSVFANEPHNLQYQWHKGDKVFAGGLLSDITYVFDVERLPLVRLSGVVPPSATRCGSAPAYYRTLADGTAYASYMGAGAEVGPCRYTNGQTREGNGTNGTPGELVRIGPDGRVIAEVPASAPPGQEGGTVVPPGLDPTAPPTNSCVNIPPLQELSCANPYGIAVREDLDRAVVGDFAELRSTNGGHPTPDFSVRDTVRVFDISNRNDPRLQTLTHLPRGPRTEPDLRLTESFGGMEPALTNQARHRGAFVGTTNGAIYYTPDVTDPNLQWRHVYDEYNAFAELFPTDTPLSHADGGGWTQVSPDDRYLYRAVMGGGPFSPGDVETGLILVLDLQPLLDAGSDPTCRIDTMVEVIAGGAEPDCPRLVSVLPIVDTTTGGPNAGAYDNFRVGRGGYYHESGRVERLAVVNYYVAVTDHDGDHRICLFDQDARGRLSLDESFRDEHLGTPCLEFDRATWPHGARGNARPHGVLFAVADADIR